MITGQNKNAMHFNNRAVEAEGGSPSAFAAMPQRAHEQRVTTLDPMVGAGKVGAVPQSDGAIPQNDGVIPQSQAPEGFLQWLW